LVIDTGGTIGSQRTAGGRFGHGGCSASASFVEVAAHRLRLQVELAPWTDARGEARLRIDSCAIDPDAWIDLGALIQRRYEQFGGIVVLHGTDTLAYTATALALSLPTLPVPVVLTGSQRPASERSSDAAGNVLLAMRAAAGRIVDLSGEIAVAFGGKLLRGSRATKASSVSAAAFVTPSLPAIEAGRVATRSSALARWRASLPVRDRVPAAAFVANVWECGVWPGIDGGRLREALRAAAPAGVVFRLFGVGAAPPSARLPSLADELLSEGVPSIAVSQALDGRIDFGVYDSTADLAASALVPGANLTAEAALVKMMWALGRGGDAAETRELLARNIAGELDERPARDAR